MAFAGDHFSPGSGPLMIADCRRALASDAFFCFFLQQVNDEEEP
jgi:hypothetical protein